MNKHMQIIVSVFVMCFFTSYAAAVGKISNLNQKDSTTFKIIAHDSKDKLARTKVVFSKKRLIFNSDTADLAHKDSNTVEGYLSNRLKPLAGTQVTTVSWSVLGWWADSPVYDSKIQPLYGDAQACVPPKWPYGPTNIKTLIKSGHCPLQTSIDFCHKNGMELFASVRMNDCHDSFMDDCGRTIWKIKHPQLMVDTKGILNGMELYVTAQDFSHEEVRQRKYEIIEEICNRYDIDGFELDYIRHPVFFSETLRGLPATQKHIEIMTSFMRKIRKLTDQTASHRKKPVLIAVRIPDTFEMSRNIGLDIQKWMQDDLVDIIITSGYSPCTVPIDEISNQAHKYKVAVCPCLNVGSVDRLANDNFLQSCRAVAANWYFSGADGIHTFNIGTGLEHKQTKKEVLESLQTLYECLYEIGNPQTLEGKNKIFAVDIEKDRAFKSYKHVSCEAPLPIFTKQGANCVGTTQRVPIVVGDDIKSAEKKGLSPHATLILKIEGLATKEMLTFLFNGEKLNNGTFETTDSKSQEHRITYSVPPSIINTGKNYIEVLFNFGQPRPPEPVKISSIILKVEYSKK